ncbi:MAG: hypothetical protein LBJ67_00325, partial [Planctomycetaceae bacterium]|nr:hypothetical protein [Planctomycetaceae bacterium]
MKSFTLTMTCCFLFISGTTLFAQKANGTTKTVSGIEKALGGSAITWTENYYERNNRLITRFLDKKIAVSEAGRAKYWKRDFAGIDAYQTSVT